MTIAIHQPNYLPWLGYFYKIYASDIFVFHDVVPFSKASYTKRCRIRSTKHSPEWVWLSVPVAHHPEGTPVRDIRISPTANWMLGHLRKIENTYRSAPYYDAIMPWLATGMREAAEKEFLAECNETLIRTICVELKVSTELRRSSEFPVAGKGSALNQAIVAHLGGTLYLAGMGSRAYEDDVLFAEKGIKIVRHNLGAWLETYPYDQGHGTFMNGLSILDALMHLDTEGVLALFQKYHQSLQNGHE